MSSTTFLDITRFLLSNLLTVFRRTPSTDDRIAVLKKMADGKMYVENVRAYFNIPSETAAFLCEQGVKEGLFKQKQGLLCANQDCRRMIYEGNSASDFPEMATCENCEDMDAPSFEFKSEQLDTMTFYTLAKHDK